MTIPNHIALIPDGNRRWARARDLPTLEGHRKGYEVAIKLGRKIRAMGVSTLTFWAFSTENWKREAREVSYLMRLCSRLIDEFTQEALSDNIQVTHIGRKDRIPKNLLKKIVAIEEKTQHNTAYYLNFALDYGGRDEVFRAIQRMYEQKINPNNLTMEQFSNFLDTANQPHPNPDLVIRTSGEARTSGLMIWQAAYAEYIFFDKHFPDLAEDDIEWAIEEYSKRQRRFGK